MKNVLLILAGAVAMFIVLKLVSSGKPIPESKTTENFKKLIATKQAQELIQTPQFKNVLLTPEFKNLAKGIADTYLIDIAKKLV